MSSSRRVGSNGPWGAGLGPAAGERAVRWRVAGPGGASVRRLRLIQAPFLQVHDVGGGRAVVPLFETGKPFPPGPGEIASRLAWVSAFGGCPVRPSAASSFGEAAIASNATSMARRTGAQRPRPSGQGPT